MSINIHTTINKANYIEIVKNSDEEITVWIAHEGELYGIWLVILTQRVLRKNILKMQMVKRKRNTLENINTLNTLVL